MDERRSLESPVSVAVSRSFLESLMALARSDSCASEVSLGRAWVDVGNVSPGTEFSWYSPEGFRSSFVGGNTCLQTISVNRYVKALGALTEGSWHRH